MILKSIHLRQFRSFTDNLFDFSPVCTIIVGENAKGKTNLLESVYFTVHGDGFRERSEEELINLTASECSVDSMWIEKDDTTRYSIHLRKSNSLVSKKHSVQKSPKNAAQYLTYQTKAVLFAPEHIDIISGSPDTRRDYVNKILSITDPEYKKRLHNYSNALYKRNKILERHKDEASLIEELNFWNGYLAENAAYVTDKRRIYCDFLNAHPSIDHRDFGVEYVVNEFTVEKARESLPEERRYRRTIIGPQKDELVIRMKSGMEKAVRSFGSRSEQRLAVFWLKLNELRYIEEVFKKKPILLLDDIFSELDEKNKSLVISLIGKYQTILTTTENELANSVGEGMTVIKL